jgi:FkbM family methyltransferase
MLTKQILDLLAQMAPSVPSWPRRQPGLLMVGGKVLRYSDLHSFYHQSRQIFGERLYDFKCPNPAPVILDCGAHIGMASLFFKEQYPAARIKAFEADAVLADMCRANFASFGVADIEISEAAVWTHDRSVSFKHTHDDAGYVSEDADAERVPSVRLKTLLAQGPVQMLKLDVEGAEFDLIEDCGEDLAAAERLIVEVHAMGSEQAKIGTLLGHLERLGFRYALGDLHQATWLPTEHKPPFTYCRTEKFIISVYAWNHRVQA